MVGVCAEYALTEEAPALATMLMLDQVMMSIIP